MQRSKQIKENILLVEPKRIIAALHKNLINIILGVVLFASWGVYIAKKQEVKSWTATCKVIRYKKEVSRSTSIPYQFKDFNYKTALDTIRTRSNLLELIETLDLNGSTPESLFSQFEIKRARGSDIVEISFTYSDRDMVAKIANTLSEIFIKNFYKTQNAAVERTYEYYKKNKEIKEKELRLTKQQIAIFLHENNITSLKNALDSNYILLRKLKQQKLENQIKIESLKTSIKETEKTLEKLPNEVKLTYEIRSANKKALELKEKELKRLQKIYAEAHPKIKLLRSEIQQLKDTIKVTKKVEPDVLSYGTNPIKQSLRIQLNKKKIEYKAAQNVDLSLQAQIENIEKSIVSLNSLNKRFDQLQIKKDEITQQLEILTNRLYTVKISIGSSKEDFKILERAKRPEFPNPTHKKIIVILFTILGFILFVGFVAIREFLSGRIKTKFDLQKRFGITDTIELPQEKKLSSISKQTFSFLANRIIAKPLPPAHIIALSTDRPPKVPAIIAGMMLEHLVFQKANILFIKSSIYPYDVKEEHSINLTIPLSKQNYTPTKYPKNVDVLYWHIQDNYCIFFPNKKDLDDSFKELKESNYDYVLIDLPSYIEAEHLIPMCIKRCDSFILYTEFKTSLRKTVLDLMIHTDESSLSKIKGVVTNVHKYFIS